MTAMDRNQAREMLAMLTADLAGVERRGNALKKLIEGLTDLYPELIEDVGDKPADAGIAKDRLRGMDAVLRVLRETQGKWFTVKLMTNELQRHGWEPDSEDPESVVRTTLARAHRMHPDRIHKGRGEKTGQVTYAYRDSWSSSEAPSSAIAAASRLASEEVQAS
jgi:hypothetical protein